MADKFFNPFGAIHLATNLIVMMYYTLKIQNLLVSQLEYCNTLLALVGILLKCVYKRIFYSPIFLIMTVLLKF